MPHYLTKEALEELKKELNERKSDQRHQISKRIEEAKELGDISENIEYAEAREAQSFNEGRIQELEEILNKAAIITKRDKGGDISIGSTVVLKDSKKEKKEITVVGPQEADPLGGKISYESPIGKGLLGHKKGDKITIKTPKGNIVYTVLEIK